MRIDVEYDQINLEQNLQRNSGSEAELRTVDSSIKIIQGFDDDADVEEFNECKETCKKMANPDRIDEEEMETFRIIDLGATQNEIVTILKELDRFFQSLDISTMSQLTDEKEVKYFKVKINGKTKKSTLHFVWDRPEKQALDVYLKNFYETCGKFK